MLHFRPAHLFLFLTAFSFSQALALQSPDWRISPEAINISVGDERTLQALDETAQELSPVEWIINDPALATASDQNGRFTLQAIQPGKLRIFALFRGERRFVDITIWEDPSQIPPGEGRWGVHEIGRELGIIAAVPEGDANLFSRTNIQRRHLPAGDQGGRNSNLELAFTGIGERCRIDLCRLSRRSADWSQSCLRLHLVYGRQ